MELAYTKPGDYYIPDIACPIQQITSSADMAGWPSLLKGTPARYLLPYAPVGNALLTCHFSLA